MRIPVSGQEIWEWCGGEPIETHVIPYMTGIGRFTLLSWKILVKSCTRQYRKHISIIHVSAVVLW